MEINWKKEVGMVRGKADKGARRTERGEVLIQFLGLSSQKEKQKKRKRGRCAVNPLN